MTNDFTQGLIDHRDISLAPKVIPERRIVTSIPNAKFVILDSENHTPLPGEPAWREFIGEIEAFLSD